MIIQYVIKFKKRTSLNYIKKVALCFMLFSCTLSAQDIISIYRKYIPKEALANESFVRMTASNLDVKAKLHPDLIYYNLEKLKKQYSEKDKEKFNEYKQYVSAVENSYLARRTRWTNKQIDDANKSEFINEMKREIVSYFTPLLRDTSNKTNTSALSIADDNNLRNFYTVLYYEKDTSAVYDSKIDYLKKRKELEKKQLDYYQNVYSSIETNNNLSLTRISEEFYLNWYLFENKENDTDNWKDPSLALQIIMKIVNKNFTISESPKFSIEAGYSIRNSLVTLSNEYPVTYSYLFSYSQQDHAYTNPVKDITPDVPQLLLSANYRLILKKHYGFLSFVDFAFLASLSLKENKSDYTTSQTSKYIVESIDIVENKGFSTNQVIVHSVNNYIVKIGVPIFAMGNSFCLNLAANAGMVHFSSTTNYAYHLIKTEGYNTSFGGSYYSHTIATGNGSGNFDVNKNYFVFYPSLELIYDTNWNMRLRGIVNNNYIAITCGITF